MENNLTVRGLNVSSAVFYTHSKVFTLFFSLSVKCRLNSLTSFVVLLGILKQSNLLSHKKKEKRKMKAFSPALREAVPKTHMLER